MNSHKKPLSLKHSRRSKSPSLDVLKASQVYQTSAPQGLSEAFISKILNHLGKAVIVIDRQARIVYANKTSLKGFGCSYDHILKHPLTEFLEERISIQKWEKGYFNKVYGEQKVLLGVVFNRSGKKTGIKTVEMVMMPLRDQSKRYVLAVENGAVKRPQSYESPIAPEDRFRFLSEQAADGIMIFDNKGVTLYANPSAARLFGTGLENLVGKHFEDYINAAAIDRARKNFRKVRGGAAIVHKEFDMKDAKGRTVLFEFTASPIIKSGKVIQVHVNFREVSEKKEIDVRKYEAEKMDAFQNFIAGTMHEIQQPLKGLLDHSQNLIDRYQDRHFEYIGYKEFKDIMTSLQTMNAQIKYCFETTDRINSLNRKKVKLAGSYCHVNAVIHDTVKLLKHSFEIAGTRLKFQLDPKLPAAGINAIDFSQVLNNILTNALQSLPGTGGSIILKTHYLKGDKALRVDCQDNGIGIPEEMLSRVFEPFFTTKSRGLEKSSGLGLYIAYSIVKAHRGQITIKSIFRKGTQVTILLPVHQSKYK